MVQKLKIVHLKQFSCQKTKKRKFLAQVQERNVTKNLSVVQSSDIRWASRWDTYLLMMDDQIHWFSIINSLMIVLFLSGMVAMIMMRTLHRDISKYNQLETADEAQEETGWKLVRSCKHPNNFSLTQFGLNMEGLRQGSTSSCGHWQANWH